MDKLVRYAGDHRAEQVAGLEVAVDWTPHQHRQHRPAASRPARGAPRSRYPGRRPHLGLGEWTRRAWFSPREASAPSVTPVARSRDPSRSARPQLLGIGHEWGTTSRVINFSIAC